MRLIDADKIESSDIHHYLGIGYADCTPDVEDLIRDQPTVDAEPVKHGRWERMHFHSEYFDITHYVCSVCDHVLPKDYNDNPFNYCHYCGARMDRKEEVDE